MPLPRGQLFGLLGPNGAGKATTSVRIFFIGGLTSYRALFGWMNPWIFIPSLLIPPCARSCCSPTSAGAQASAWPQLALVVAVGSLASTGLGLVMGAINLVYRDGATMGNVFFLVLLIFTGTNVALDDLPGWMAAIGRCLPLSHAIEASRMLADGATWAAVQGLVGRELLIGMVYVAVGLAAIRWFEHLSRAGATLDRF